MEEGGWVEEKQLLIPELLYGGHAGHLKTFILFRNSLMQLKKGKNIVHINWFHFILH